MISVTPTSIAQIVPNLNINSQRPISKITPRRLFHKQDTNFVLPTVIHAERSAEMTKTTNNQETYENAGKMTTKSRSSVASSCSNKTSAKSHLNKKAEQTKREIEQLKAELQALIDSNNIKNPINLETKSDEVAESKCLVQPNENVISTRTNVLKDIKSPDRRKPPEEEPQNDEIRENTKLTPKVKSVRKKPSSPSIESMQIESPTKVRHYDPKQAREYMKKQRQLRRNKLLEEIDSKKRLQEEKKRKLKELQENTLKILVTKNNQKKASNAKRTGKETNTQDIDKNETEHNGSQNDCNKFEGVKSVDSNLIKSDVSSQPKPKSQSNSISINSTSRHHIKPIHNPDIETDSLDSVLKPQTDKKVSRNLQPQHRIRPVLSLDVETDSLDSVSKQKTDGKKISRVSQSKDELKRYRAACKIQSVYRGYSQRKKYLNMMRLLSSRLNVVTRPEKSTVDIETQTNFIKNQKKEKDTTPTWLQPADSLIYPFNFINTVKQKINLAINGQRFTQNTNDSNTSESCTFLTVESSNRSNKNYSDSFKNTILSTSENTPIRGSSSTHFKDKTKRRSHNKEKNLSIGSNIDYSIRKQKVSVAGSSRFSSNNDTSQSVLKSLSSESKTPISDTNPDYFRVRSLKSKEEVIKINESDVESHSKVDLFLAINTDTSTNNIDSTKSHGLIESQNELTSSKIFSLDFPEEQIQNKDIYLSENTNSIENLHSECKNPISSIVEDLKLDLRGINSDTSQLSQDLTLSDNEIRSIIHSLSRRKHSSKTSRSKSIKSTEKDSKRTESNIINEKSSSVSGSKDKISPTGESINTNSTGRDVESAILSSDKNVTPTSPKMHLNQILINTENSSKIIIDEENEKFNKSTEHTLKSDAIILKPDSNSFSSENMKKSTDSESSSKHLTAAQMLVTPSDKLDVKNIFEKNISSSVSVVDNVKSLVTNSTNVKLHPNVTLRDHQQGFSSVDVKRKSNEICLKFQAEFRLLDSFNESLNRIQEMNKEFLIRTDQKSENKRTQTSPLSDISKNYNKSESIVENLNSIVDTINRSIQSIQSYSAETSSKPISSALTERSSIDNIISELKSVSSTKLSQSVSAKEDIENIQTVEPVLSTSFEMSKIADSFSSGLDATLISMSHETQKAKISDLPNITVDMIEQQIRNEDAQLEHFKTLLKIREKALIDRTKGELAWLELTKKQLRNNGEIEKASAVKKKQRGILLKLQQEKHEMQRLKQMHIASAQERKIILKEQKTMIKKQLSTKEMLTKFKRHKPVEHKRTGPLKVYSFPNTSDSVIVSADSSDKSFSVSEEISVRSSRTVTSEKNSISESLDFRKSVTIKANNQIVDANQLKKLLSKREQDLRKRRQIAEELLDWHQKLSEEEKHVIALEKEAKFLAKNEAKSFTLKGLQLNRLWRKITGNKEIKYSPEETYMMTKQDLDAFYESAKQELFKRIFVMRRSESVMSGVKELDYTSTDISDEHILSEFEDLTSKTRESVLNRDENRSNTIKNTSEETIESITNKSSSERSNSKCSSIKEIETESIEPISNENLSADTESKNITSSTQSQDNIKSESESLCQTEAELSLILNDNSKESVEKLLKNNSDGSKINTETSHYANINNILNLDKQNVSNTNTPGLIQFEEIQIQVENITDSIDQQTIIAKLESDTELEETLVPKQNLLNECNSKGDVLKDISVSSSSIKSEINEENSLMKNEISLQTSNSKQNHSCYENTIDELIDNNLMNNDPSILCETKQTSSEILDNSSKTNIDIDLLNESIDISHFPIQTELVNNSSGTKESNQNIEIKEETDLISIAEAVNALTLSSESNISEKISCAKNNEFEKCSPTSDNAPAQKTQPEKPCSQFNSLDDKTQSDEIDSILISEISEVTESAENLTDLQVSEQNLVKSETEKSIYDALCKIQSNSDSKHSKNTENHSKHKKNELDMISIKSSTESQINEPDSTYEHHSCEIDSLNVSLTNSSSNNKSIYSGCETPVHGSKNSTSKFNKNVEHKLPVENSSVQEAHAVSQQSDILNTSHCLDDFEREFDENNGQNIQLLRNEYKKNADVPKTVAPNRENLIIDEVNNSTQIPDIVKSHIETKKSSDISFESEKTSRSVESPETYSKNTLVSEYSSDYKNKFKTDVLESPAVFFEDAVFPEKEFETSAMKDSSSKVDIQSDFERASQKTISSGEIQSEVEEFSIDEENDPKVIPNLISSREELNDSFQFKNTDSKLIFDQFNEISEKISDNSQEKYNDNFKNSRSIYLDDHKSKPNKITGRIGERDIKCTENLYSYSQKVADIGSVVDKLKDSSLSIESESKESECISSPFVSKSNESDHNISQKISDICSEESKSSTDIHSSSNKSNLNRSDSKHNISSEGLNTDNEKSVYRMNKTNCNQDENNKSIDFKNEDSIIENLSCSSDKSNLVKEENIKYGALEILKSSTKILQQNRKFETCSDQNEYSFDSSENQIEIEVIEEKTEESPSKSRSDGLNYTIEKIKIESTSREKRPENTALQEIFASNEETDGANKEIVSDEKSDYSYKAESKFSNDMKNQTREEKSVHVKELSVFISNDVENINELNEVYSNQENIPATLGVKTINSVEDIEETSKNEELKEHENITFSLPVPSLSDESLLDNVTLSNIVDVTSSIDGQYVKIEKSVESDDDTVSYEESFADDSKSKHSSSSDNSQVSGNDSVHTSGENSSSGSIDVRKRVREILADVSPVKNGQKSPRVQDLWVTTYDVPSSPDCSPESASPMKDVPTANLPSATESIVSEAEELRRKQLEIEQEIKELEKQQNDALPFVYVREIPNKPPPPYTPPSPQLTPSVPKSEKVPILMQSKTVTTIVTEIANTLYDAYSERNLADVEPSVSFYTLEERDDIDVSSKRFLFDLCKDVVMNELIEQDEDIPSWRKEKLHRNVKRPKSKSEFTRVVDEKVKQLLGLSVVNRKENLIICWSRKKRDHVDELLVRELQVEEAEWTNFDNDEITVKNELTDDIFNLLIADTVSVTTIALEKKFENLTSL